MAAYFDGLASGTSMLSACVVVQAGRNAKSKSAQISLNAGGPNAIVLPKTISVVALPESVFAADARGHGRSKDRIFARLA